MSTDIDADEERNTRLRGVQANGLFIFRARRVQGLTQESLAAAAHCDEKTIRRAEKGCRLDFATLLRIAKALEMPFRNLVESRSSSQES